LIDFFKDKELLEEIDGYGKLEEISQRILDLFEKKGIE